MVRGESNNLLRWGTASRRLASAVILGLALGLCRTRPPWRGAPPVAIDPTLVVDANSAPVTVLVALPRVGPVIAGRIVRERERKRFRSLADLDARVRGVGPATVAAVRPYLTFPGGPDPGSNRPAD